MYVRIHTITIIENNWVVEAKIFEATSLNVVGKIIAKRITLRALPLRIGNKGRLLKKNGIFKRKNSTVRHQFRTVKM